MANLQDILQSAQGGKAAENLAERFGITPEQASAAIQALTPAFSTGLQQAIQNPSSLTTIIGQLTAGLHQASFQNPDSAHSEAAVAGGSTILNQIFGNSSVTGEIAQQAARVTGLRPDLIMQMAPVIATMMAGGLANSLKSQGFSNILGQLGGAISSGGGKSGLCRGARRPIQLVHGDVQRDHRRSNDERGCPERSSSSRLLAAHAATGTSRPAASSRDWRHPQTLIPSPRVQFRFDAIGPYMFALRFVPIARAPATMVIERNTASKQYSISVAPL